MYFVYEGVGDGTHPSYPKLEIPRSMRVRPNGTLDDLIDFVFPGLERRISEPDYMTGRVILAPTNVDVDNINITILSRISSTSKTYYSADSVEGPCDSHRNLYPVEFLNTLNINGLPPHKLCLKEGVIICLLRNMNKCLGLCNGTRLIVRHLQDHVIEAEVVTGKEAGRRVYIPRIPMNPADNSLPFELRRVQFPVRVAFAMTINKAQGQTLSHVGLYLQKPVFCHGQLYVALSRVKRASSIRVFLPQGETSTTNAVYLRSP